MYEKIIQVYSFDIILSYIFQENPDNMIDSLSQEFSLDLIDEEKVLIEDLELDEESDDKQQRKSDIKIEGL